MNIIKSKVVKRFYQRNGLNISKIMDGDLQNSEIATLKSDKQ